MKSRTALGAIDVQRGLMPIEEGKKLGSIPGFGELPVPDGQQVVSALNRLIESEVQINYIFTTQDWHPATTAHFSDEPNYSDTWPIHCVARTPGAKIHPLLTVQGDNFIKGNETLVAGEDDTSYSGYNATIEKPTGNQDYIKELPKTLEKKGITKLILGGLALDYCIKATALDFNQKTNIDVVVLSDATMPVTKETGRLALQEMVDAGIRIASVDDMIAELKKESS